VAAAAPIADNASGGTDQRNNGIIIIGLEPAFDHQVDRASRQPGIAITVIAKSMYANPLANAFECALIGAFEHGRSGRGQACVGKGAADAGCQLVPAFSIDEYRTRAIADIALAKARHIDDTKHRLTIAQQPDQRDPGRDSANEGARPVDRVEAPAPGTARRASSR